MKKLFLLSALVLGTTACSPSPVPEPIIETPPAEVKEELTLTQDLLVAGDWGPIGELGRYIEFNDDGTFLATLAGEGDGPREGTYQIEGEAVVLTPNIEEAPWSLTLAESTNDLYYTLYLAQDGSVAYWDRSKPVPEGSERTVDTYSVITVDSAAELKPEATPKSKPEVDAPVYEFRFCGEGCSVGEVESFSGAFTGVIARTENKDLMNGVEDYWYLVGVELGWYSAALIEGETDDGVKISYAWVHGSELQ